MQKYVRELLETWRLQNLGGHGLQSDRSVPKLRVPFTWGGGVDCDMKASGSMHTMPFVHYNRWIKFIIL